MNKIFFFTITLFLSLNLFAHEKGRHETTQSKSVDINKVKNSSKLEELGFKNGDIINLNDGSKVDSAAKAIDLYNELKRSKVEVVETSKENNGFGLSEVVKGSIYEKMGLRKGDVIKSYKGKPVKTADEVIKMYSELVKNGNVNDLEVERAIER